MNLKEIKALTFDTGGTVLDWHSGFRDAFAAAGSATGSAAIGRLWPMICGGGRCRRC